MGTTVDLNVNNWGDEVGKSEILTVVYFWHNQCPWCMRLNPILDEVIEKYVGRIKFTKLNVLESTDNQEIASNLGVMSTPTLMFFCSGRPISQAVGSMSKEDLEKILNDMLGKYRTCLRQSSDLRNYVV